MGVKIRVLGSWWDSPQGDFPIRALASRLRELRDAEVLVEGDEYVVSLSLYEDTVNYGYAVLFAGKDRAFMVMLQSVEDWEALKERVKERCGDVRFSELVKILTSIAEKGSGIIEVP